MNATLANLKVTTDKFNSADNSIGLLLNDRMLYDNLNSTADNASKLLLDLREHPKRYVHFSIFGKKILPNKKYFCHSVYSCIREYDIEARLNPFIVSIIERISIKGIRIRL